MPLALGMITDVQPGTNCIAVWSEGYNRREVRKTCIVLFPCEYCWILTLIPWMLSVQPGKHSDAILKIVVSAFWLCSPFWLVYDSTAICKICCHVSQNTGIKSGAPERWQIGGGKKGRKAVLCDSRILLMVHVDLAWWLIRSHCCVLILVCAVTLKLHRAWLVNYSLLSDVISLEERRSLPDWYQFACRS